MDTRIYRLKKWTNYLFWYQHRCFEIKDMWLHYYWDTDDIGRVVRGSMNLHSVKATRVNSRTLHLSSRNLTYYLKSDSEKDMQDFICGLQEMDVLVSDT
ncbi:oxysterol-binding protein 2-like [Calypte anna]|uniref:oxysterol-binding protein 2-like n=1 Tax=Calypte anna TaxID=9244 RepID=UPI0011C45FBA|nr:oxysterol-binding protein 2-like [Calypte anna]